MYHTPLSIDQSVDQCASVHITVPPCPGYCKQCCREHWGTCAFFSYGFLRVYDQQWGCWVIWLFIFLGVFF